MVVWSLTSGKRQIQFNNKEIHYSSSRGGVLDFSWTTKANHVIKVLCHASPPLSPEPGFRQYELFVDGQSFFTMPKVYELGIKSSTSSYNQSVTAGPSDPTSPLTVDSGLRSRLPAPTTREQEEADLQRAIRASIQESRAHLGRHDDSRSAYTTPNDTLLDFATPAPAPQPPSDARSVASYLSAPPASAPNAARSYNPAPYQAPPSPAGVGPGALVPSYAPSGYYPGAPAMATPTYAAPPPAAPPAFASPAPVPPVPPAPPAPPAPSPPQQYMPAPVPAPMPTPTQPAPVFGLNSVPGHDPFAPQAPDPTNSILGAYSAPPPTGTSNGDSKPVKGSAAAPLSMNVLAQQEDETPQDEVSAALMKLVNVDRIDEPADYNRLTMMQKEEKKKKQTTKNGKSVPLPPVASGMVGPNATLSQISSTKSEIPKYEDGKVMNAPPPGVFQAGAAAAGALVVHGQGPPPLNSARGFGVGAQLPNGGFTSQPMPGHYYQQQPQY